MASFRAQPVGGRMFHVTGKPVGVWGTDKRIKRTCISTISLVGVTGNSASKQSIVSCRSLSFFLSLSLVLSRARYKAVYTRHSTTIQLTDFVICSNQFSRRRQNIWRHSYTIRSCDFFILLRSSFIFIF